MILVLGFEGFAGNDLNPSGVLARRVHGAHLANHRIEGRVLPVDLARLDGELDAALASKPAAVLALGLAAGESAIRLERFAVNLADFAVADNAGALARDRKLAAAGPAALAARLPLRRVHEALLEAGIPSRLSNSAGTYLCNATLYRLLERLPARVPCGFVHLPHLPEEAARQIARGVAEAPASMALELQAKALDIVLASGIASSLADPTLIH